MIPLCTKCMEEYRADSIPQPTQDGKPIRVYFLLFHMYTAGASIRLGSELAKERFIQGLSEDNKAELSCMGPLPSLDDIVNYLTMVEKYKRDIFSVLLPKDN